MSRKHYPSLSHSKWSRVDAEENNIFGCCAVSRDILPVRSKGILQWIIDMSYGSWKTDTTQCIT